MMSLNELRDIRAIGYNIAKMLEKKEMSAGDLAACLPCSEIHVQAVLKGSVELEDRELDAIAQCLGVSVSDILQEADDGLKDYNVHYMGKAPGRADMDKLMDEVDFYVRLLNS